jgi:tetratricopeptide (TPR) repeat protein
MLEWAESGGAQLGRGVREGLAHYAAGRLLEAARAWQRALDDDSRDGDALTLLGMVARRAGQHAAAIRLTELAVRLRPESAGFQMALAQAHLAAKEPDAAEACCRKALELDPQSVAAWCGLGDVEAARGNEEKARQAGRSL